MAFFHFGNPENAKGFRGCQPPHPAADEFVHSLLTMQSRFGLKDRGGMGQMVHKPALDDPGWSRLCDSQSAAISSRISASVSVKNRRDPSSDTWV